MKQPLCDLGHGSQVHMLVGEGIIIGAHAVHAVVQGHDPCKIM